MEADKKQHHSSKKLRSSGPSEIQLCFLKGVHSATHIRYINKFKNVSIIKLKLCVFIKKNTSSFWQGR